MISVEKFGGGALRVSYDDGRGDWMFWPFEEGADCEQAFVTGETTFWVYRRRNGIEAAIFEAGQRVCVQRNQFGAHESFANRRGDHLVLHRLSDSHSNPDRTNHIAIVRGSDLSEALRIEDSRLYIKTSIYQRYDGAIIVGTPAGPDQAAWIVTFDGGEARMKELPGSLVPQGLGAKSSYCDPTGRRVATVGAETAPIERAGNETLYGIPVQLWDLRSLKVEKTVIVDRVPAEFSAGFAGQDRMPRGDENRQKWEQRLAVINPAVWDGSLNDGDGDLDAVRRDFICSNIRDIAWEPDGEAFWAVFSAGYLRRVTVDGSVSARYVIQRLATPPVKGKRGRSKAFFQVIQKPSSLEYLPNGELRIMTMHAMSLLARDFKIMVRYADQGGVVQFDPSKFSRKGGLIRRLLSPLASPRVDGILVSTWRDGFIPQEHTEFKLLLEMTREDDRAARRKDKAVEARKAAFLKGAAAPAKKTAAPGKKAAAAKAGEPPVAAPDPKPLLGPGKIEVEKFGYEISGALRVTYGDGSEDWMFLPFSEDDLKEFHILGDDRILAVSSRELKLYDAKSRTCLGRRRVGYHTTLYIATNGEWFAGIGELDGETQALAVFGGHDFSEMLLLEESNLKLANPAYERYDGALIAGLFKPGPEHTIYVVTVNDGAARVEKHTIIDRHGVYQNNWPCPNGKRVVAAHASSISIAQDGDSNSYGFPLEIWDMETLGMEREIVVDYLPRRLQLKDNFDPPDWDGSLTLAPSLDEEETKRLTAIHGQVHSFLRDEVRGIAWEADGNAFWVMFAAGFLRRVSLDGSVSPRCIVERIWSPSPQAKETHLGFGIEMRPDGRLRIDCVDYKNDRRGYVYAQPELVEQRAAAGEPDQEIWIRKAEDGYELKPPFKYRSDDKALEARKKAFCERVMEAPFPLADMSAPSCIDAIERLTGAISRDPYELVCGSSFRPTFVLPANGSARGTAHGRGRVLRPCLGQGAGGRSRHRAAVAYVDGQGAVIREIPELLHEQRNGGAVACAEGAHYAGPDLLRHDPALHNRNRL